MKIFTTLAIVAAMGVVWGCSSSDDTGGGSDAGTGATGGGGTGGGGTGGMAGMGAMGGTGAMGGMGATGGGGTGGTGGSDCGTCMQTNCGTELSTCGANADCMKILQCAANCTDSACITACEDANPNGKTDWNAMYSCISQNCATECGG